METTTATGAQAATAVQLAAETLTGDLRDALLMQLRSMGETPWSKLSENDQAWRIAAIEKFGETLVRRAMAIVAHQGFPHLDVRVSTKGKYDADGIDLTAKATFTLDNLMRLGEHKGGSAILVLTEVGEFFGQRRAARAEPDQRAMPLDEGEGEETAAADAGTYAGLLRMVEATPELIGLTFDLTGFTEEERSDLATKIIAKRGKVFLGPTDKAGDDTAAEAEATETEATDQATAEAPSKPARRARRQIRETEAA